MRGPFLVIAPLSTIPHWLREFESWCDLNVLVYAGGKDNREMIRDYEFHQFEVNGQPKELKNKYRFNVLICTYDSAMSDTHFLGNIDWQVMVVDEAHRLKNNVSKLSSILQEQYTYHHCILLTGTPLQNNLSELWSLLHILHPDTFTSESEFMKQYGSLQTSNEVQQLHTLLRPYLLRRMKHDVEKSLLPRVETVIEVDLTPLQKQYYRAIYERNTQYLLQLSGKTSMPSLMNVAMQLRHVANHPYLIKGAEVEIGNISGKGQEKQDTMQTLIQASGKFVLLSKLLPRLQSRGHRVLIFSQFKKVLDILEDFLVYLDMKYERMDGDITGNHRQNAIDRFSKPDSDRFVFLLSTKAGGVGINLASADTVILFDSDWNPQNDVQAQARAHRIGQTKKVQVYRLITRGTYEQEMFSRASMKLGLDHAVLKSFGSGASEMAPLKRAEVEKMLKLGAFHVFLENVDEHQLNEEDIDKILERDAKIIEYSNGNNEEKGGSTSASSFAKASFVLNGETIDLDAPDFWQKMGLKPVAEPELPKSRERKQVDYTSEWRFLDDPSFREYFQQTAKNKKKRRRKLGDEDEEISELEEKDSDESNSSSGSSSEEDPALAEVLTAKELENFREAKRLQKRGRLNKGKEVQSKDAHSRVIGTTPTPTGPVFFEPCAIRPRVATAIIDGLEKWGYNRWQTLRSNLDCKSRDKAFS